jgi:hypothetical protein
MGKLMRVTSLIAVTSLSCSVALQPSVRSSSVECSTSIGYAAVDAVVAGGFGFQVSRGIGHSPRPANVVPAGIATGVMVTSALIGLYKRHNCARWRETAPPEVWAEVAERHRREAEAEAQAARAAATAQEQVAATAPDEAQPACPEGTTAIGDACACPEGLVWDGAQCVTADSGPSGSPPPPPPTSVYVQNTTRNTTINNTTINTTVNRPSSSRRVWHAPPPALFCAVYQPSAGATMSRQQSPDMQGCNRFCTGLLAQKLKCQCVQGGC